MKHILHNEKVSAQRRGESDYVLISRQLKSILENNNLGEKFNKDKHDVFVRAGLNKVGQAYAEFWFVPKELKDEKAAVKDASE